MDINQMAKQQSREHLIPFCITMDKNYDVNFHHRVTAEGLEEVERGEIDLLIIEEPPRHGKSQLASVYFPAWYLGRNADKEIITASYSGDLAEKFGGETRDLISDEQYKLIFETRLKHDSKSKGKWETEQGGSYTSVGRGGATTGRGANVLLIDDPLKDREEAESKVIRDKCWDWYRSVALTRLEKGGAVVLIMTRWHTDDLVGRVIEKAVEMGKKFKRIRFPAIAEEDEKYRKKGEALWPEKYPLVKLQEIKDTIGVYDWQALYQQNPIASEIQEFKQEWFQYFTDEDVKDKDLYYYALVDLAISDKQGADNTAVVVIGKEIGKPEIYVDDIYAGHFDPLQVIEYLFALKARYRGKFIRVGIESVAYQKALHYFLADEMKKRQSYFDCVELKAKNAKEMRIRGLIPLYKTHVLFHRNNQKELEEELLVFPRGKHDDRADALAYIPQVLESDLGDQVVEHHDNSREDLNSVL